MMEETAANRLSRLKRLVAFIYLEIRPNPPPLSKKVLIPPPAYVFIILLYCYAFGGGCMISLISFDTCENPIFSVL